jgi:hypothetical protein
MTQRLIYGKTVKIEGDIVSFDGVTYMDPFDDTGVTPPIAFTDTAFVAYPGIVFGGQTGTVTGTLLMTRNGSRMRLEMRSDSAMSVIPSGTTLTLQIPSVSPQVFYPNTTAYFVANLWNGSAVVQSPGTISNTGLITFTGLTAATTYTFRYGLVTALYI